MRVLDVLESKVWNHIETGKHVSIYGAVPWYNDTQKQEWELKVVGWTWKMDNGTVGMGRKPAATRKEALMVMRRNHARLDAPTGVDEKPQYIECEQCMSYHSVEFFGDCRDDDERYFEEELNEFHGMFGWTEVYEEETA